MKKYFAYIMVLLLFWFVTSCSNKKIDKRVSQIDSLSRIIDSVDQKLILINKDTIVRRYHEYKTTIDSVAQHIKELRNEESWKYICAYQEVRKPFKTMALNYLLYRAEIDSTAKQLLDLKHDIKHKLITEQEYDVYYQNECNSVNAVFNKVSNTIDNVNLQMKNFDTVHPYLIKLLNNRCTDKTIAR